MSELNPNHEMTAAMREQWQKIAAVLVTKLGGGHIVLTAEDIMQYPSNSFMTIEEKEDGIHLRMVDQKEAERLAKEEGGLVN